MMKQTKSHLVARIARLVAFSSAVSVAGEAMAADTVLLPRNLSPWGMFINADIVVKAVMIGLALASLVTWTAWLAKTIELRHAGAIARRRLHVIDRRATLAEIGREIGDGRDAVAQIVQSAAREVALSEETLDDGLK